MFIISGRFSKGILQIYKDKYPNLIKKGTKTYIKDVPFISITIKGIVLVDRELSLKGYIILKVKNDALYYTNMPIIAIYVKVNSIKRWFLRTVLCNKYRLGLINGELEGY